MLVEFSVENFLSFKDSTTFSMVAAKSFREHSKTNLINTDFNMKLLKSAIIYGNNASGKSNLFASMSFMKATVLNSFRDALMDNFERKFPLEKFELNSKTINEPSYFEITFIHKEVKYRYGFEIDFDAIKSEWLFHTTTREVNLFKRENQEIKINKTSFKEGIGKENDVKDNVLFVSLLATLGKEISSDIVDWFKAFNLINGIHDRGHKRYTIDKLKTDNNFFNWVKTFVKYLDISNISTTEEDVNEIDLEILKNKEKDEELINLFSSIQKIQSKQPKRDQLLTYHKRYDENNLFLDTVAFNFDEQESEGTKKLIYLLGPWYDTLKTGKILVIDEIDSRLHSHLTSKLISFFHEFNRNNAQLICVAHDISLLNKNVFRRDQIWFIEKNQFESSELYSLSDFKTDKVRGLSAFDKNYLDGKFGAIPYFENDEKLKNIIYEQTE